MNSAKGPPTKPSPKLAKMLSEATPQQLEETLRVTAKLLAIRARKMQERSASDGNAAPQMTSRSTSSQIPLKLTDPYPMQEERVRIGDLNAPPPDRRTYDPPPSYELGKVETSEPPSR